MSAARKPLPNLNKLNEAKPDAGDRPPFSELLVKLVQKKPTYTMVAIAAIMFVFRVWNLYTNYVPAEPSTMFSKLKMQAVLSKEMGDASILYIGSAPKPAPRSNEVLVRVKAFGISRIDLLQREGKYPPPTGASPILGVEFSGVVVEIGKNVRKLKIGDRIAGLSNGGSYAEFVVTEEAMSFQLPTAVNFEQGAVIPEAFFTSYKAMFSIGGIKEGKNVLIHGGAGGVGSIAIQMAKLAGAKMIFATTSTSDKAKHCEKLGANKVINYRTDDFEDFVLRETEGEGVDIIIDFIGGEYWNKNLNILASGGKMVLLGMLSPPDVFETNIGTILRKRLRIEGWDLRSCERDELVKLAKEVQSKIMPSLTRKIIRPIVDKAFSWIEITDAHQHLEEGLNKGKVVAVVE